MESSHSVVPGNARAEMARRSVRQSDLASALGITQQAVSQKLNGRRPFTDVEIEKMSKRLGIDPGRLFAAPAAEGDASMALAAAGGDAA